MPGQTHTRNQIAKANAYTKGDMTGEDAIFDLVLSGMKIDDITRTAGLSSNGMLYAWMKDKKATDEEGVTRWDRYQKVKKLRADMLEGDVLDIADKADTLSPGGVQKAKLQTEVRRWLIDRNDPENAQYRNGVRLEVSIADLHLEALKQVNREVIEGEVA